MTPLLINVPEKVICFKCIRERVKNMKKGLKVIAVSAMLAATQPLCSFGASSITVGTGADGVQLEGATSDGAQVSLDSGGTARLSFAKGKAATAGLPQAVVDAINAIDSGNVPLNEAVQDAELAGYNALVKTSALVVTEIGTQAPATGKVSQTLYVPNLVEGLGTVQLLFYDNATGKWTLITPDSVDYTSKKITAGFTGSGTFSVVYKK